MMEPLFILAPARSFTSVVCGMVGQHPQLYGLPEVNLFAASTVEELARWHRLRPRFRHGLLRAIAELGLGGQTEESIDAADLWLEEHPDVSTAAIYRDLVDWADGRGLVDKSPIYVVDEKALPRIDAAFPAARFIHLTRHPRATCDSLYGLRQYIAAEGGFAGRFELDPDRIWLKPHARIKTFLERLSADRWIRVRGEDLLGDPDRYLAQVAEWLGLRTDRKAVEAMKHPERSPFACMGPPNAQYGNDPGFMEKPELRPFKAKPLNLEDPLGYDPRLSFSDAVKHYAEMFGYGD